MDVYSLVSKLRILMTLGHDMSINVYFDYLKKADAFLYLTAAGYTKLKNNSLLKNLISNYRRETVTEELLGLS